MYIIKIIHNNNHIKMQQQQQQQRKQQQQNKAFCAVCKNAGKTQEEYTSHWTRASPRPDSQVVCPTILNSICTYCKGKGHFKSNCSILKSNNEKKTSMEMNKIVKLTAPVSTESRVPKNIYEVFHQETKQIIKKEDHKKMDFPVLFQSSKKMKNKDQEQETKITYAKIAAFTPAKEEKKIPNYINSEDRAKEIQNNLFSQ